MNSRAVCGGTYAFRNCPSLGPRLHLSASLLSSAGLVTTTKAPLLLLLPKSFPSIWGRSSHFLRNSPSNSQHVTSNKAKHYVLARTWPGDRVSERTCSSQPSATLRCASRATVWLRPGDTRCFSQTNRFLREQDETKSKDEKSSSHPPSAQPPAPELRGIRKVIPKVLPALTQHENIYTVPNILTFSRLIAAPFVGYAILHDAHAWALGLYVYAGVSDLLDGWIARQWKLQTVVGSIVDPMADKTLMTVLTVCLACKGALPVWLAVIILGRDIGLGIAAIYYRWISLPPPKTFTRYWDFSLPSAEVRPTTISKYNTFLQLGLMGATMVTPFLSADVAVAMTAFQYLVAATTVWSGLSYVFSKDAVRILSESKTKPKGR